MESSSSSNSIHPDAGSALVDALVEYLNDNVLDPDNKITKLDMLDSLASIGGQLVPDPEGSSSDEYFEELPRVKPVVPLPRSRGRSPRTPRG